MRTKELNEDRQHKRNCFFGKDLISL
jgi:hypothetical protein